MNTEENEGFEPIEKPTRIHLAWGWDNDKAHKPAHYELIWLNFQTAAEQFPNTNLTAQKVDYDGFQILHYNKNTQQLFGTVRKWVWDPHSMKRQLLDLVFTKSRTELVIEYRGNNRPGTVVYRLCYAPGNINAYGGAYLGRMEWMMVQDTTARPLRTDAFPLEGKQFTKWLARAYASVRTTLKSDSAENLTWLLGALDAWQVKDVIEEADFPQLRLVAVAHEEAINELALARRLAGEEKVRVHFSREVVTRLLYALEPLTKPGTPSLGKTWARQVGGKILHITLDPNDPNPIATVSFLIDEYRGRKFPGVVMDVKSKGTPEA